MKRAQWKWSSSSNVAPGLSDMTQSQTQAQAQAPAKATKKSSRRKQRASRTDSSRRKKQQQQQNRNRPSLAAVAAPGTTSTNTATATGNTADALPHQHHPKPKRSSAHSRNPSSPPSLDGAPGAVAISNPPPRHPDREKRTSRGTWPNNEGYDAVNKRFGQVDVPLQQPPPHALSYPHQPPPAAPLASSAKTADGYSSNPSPSDLSFLDDDEVVMPRAPQHANSSSSRHQKRSTVFDADDHDLSGRSSAPIAMPMPMPMGEHADNGGFPGELSSPTIPNKRPMSRHADAQHSMGVSPFVQSHEHRDGTYAHDSNASGSPMHASHRHQSTGEARRADHGEDMRSGHSRATSHVSVFTNPAAVPQHTEAAIGKGGATTPTRQRLKSIFRVGTRSKRRSTLKRGEVGGGGGAPPSDPSASMFGALSAASQEPRSATPVATPAADAPEKRRSHRDRSATAAAAAATSSSSIHRAADRDRKHAAATGSSRGGRNSVADAPRQAPAAAAAGAPTEVGGGVSSMFGALSMEPQPQQPRQRVQKSSRANSVVHRRQATKPKPNVNSIFGALSAESSQDQQLPPPDLSASPVHAHVAHQRSATTTPATTGGSGGGVGTERRVSSIFDTLSTDQRPSQSEESLSQINQRSAFTPKMSRSARKTPTQKVSKSLTATPASSPAPPTPKSTTPGSTPRGVRNDGGANGVFSALSVSLQQMPTRPSMTMHIPPAPTTPAPPPPTPQAQHPAPSSAAAAAADSAMLASWDGLDDTNFPMFKPMEPKERRATVQQPLIALPPSEEDVAVRPAARPASHTVSRDYERRPIGRRPLVPKYMSMRSQSAAALERDFFDYSPQHEHGAGRGAEHLIDLERPVSRPSAQPRPHSYGETLAQRQSEQRLNTLSRSHEMLQQRSMSPPLSPVAGARAAQDGGGYHSLPLPGGGSGQRSPPQEQHHAGVSSVPMAHNRPHHHHRHHSLSHSRSHSPSHSPIDQESGLAHPRSHPRSHSPSPTEMGAGQYFRTSPTATPSPVSVPYSGQSHGSYHGSAGGSLRGVQRFVSPTTPPPTQHSLERYESSSVFSHSMHHTPKSHTQTPNQLHLAAQLREQAIRDQELYLQEARAHEMQRAQIDRRLRARTLGPMRGADVLNGGGQRTRGFSRAASFLHRQPTGINPFDALFEEESEFDALSHNPPPRKSVGIPNLTAGPAPRRASASQRGGGTSRGMPTMSDMLSVSLPDEEMPRGDAGASRPPLERSATERSVFAPSTRAAAVHPAGGRPSVYQSLGTSRLSTAVLGLDNYLPERRVTTDVSASASAAESASSAAGLRSHSSEFARRPQSGGSQHEMDAQKHNRHILERSHTLPPGEFEVSSGPPQPFLTQDGHMSQHPQQRSDATERGHRVSHSQSQPLPDMEAPAPGQTRAQKSPVQTHEPVTAAAPAPAAPSVRDAYVPPHARARMGRFGSLPRSFGRHQSPSYPHTHNIRARHFADVPPMHSRSYSGGGGASDIAHFADFSDTGSDAGSIASSVASSSMYIGSPPHSFAGSEVASSVSGASYASSAPLASMASQRHMSDPANVNRQHTAHALSRFPSPAAHSHASASADEYRTDSRPFAPSSAPNGIGRSSLHQQHHQQQQPNLSRKRGSGGGAPQHKQHAHRSHSASSVGSATGVSDGAHSSGNTRRGSGRAPSASANVNATAPGALAAKQRPAGHSSSSASACPVAAPQQMHASVPTDAQKRSELVQDPQTKSKFRAFCSVLRKKEKDGSFAEAFKYGHEGFTTFPSNIHWRILLELADLCKRQNRIDDSREYYRRVNKMQPFAAQGWLEHAKLEEEFGELTRCKGILFEGLYYCPFMESLLIKKLKLEERMSNTDEARRLLARLMHFKAHKVWKVVLEGALMEARAGNSDVARHVLKYLMAHVPWYGPVYHEAYRFHEKHEEYAEALSIIEEGLVQIPRYGPLWFGAFRLYEKLEPDNIDRVRAKISRASEEISKELKWKVHFEMAQLEERIANYDGARSSYVLSVRFCSKNLRWKVWIGGARMELHAGRVDIARELLRQAMRQVPVKMRAMVLLEFSRLEEYIGNVDEARETLRRAREDVNYEWKVFLESILLEIRAENYAEAIVQAKNALKIHSGTGRLWALYIQLMASEGCAALPEIFSDALQQVPKSGEVWCEGARLSMNPCSPHFDLLAAQRYLGFAVKFTPQYGDSFIEHLRLEMILEGPAAAAEKLQQLCRNGDPNYGALWIYCKQSHLDSPADVMRYAREVIFGELYQHSILYQNAVLNAMLATSPPAAQHKERRLAITAAAAGKEIPQKVPAAAAGGECDLDGTPVSAPPAAPIPAPLVVSDAAPARTAKDTPPESNTPAAGDSSARRGSLVVSPVSSASSSSSWLSSSESSSSSLRSPFNDEHDTAAAGESPLVQNETSLALSPSAHAERRMHTPARTERLKSQWQHSNMNSIRKLYPASQALDREARYQLLFASNVYYMD